MDLQNNALFSSCAYLECYCSLFRRVRNKTCSPSAATLLTQQHITSQIKTAPLKSPESRPHACTDYFTQQFRINSSLHSHAVRHKLEQTGVFNLASCGSYINDIASTA